LRNIRSSWQLCSAWKFSSVIRMIASVYFVIQIESLKSNDLTLSKAYQDLIISILTLLSNAFQ
jgi:hypothetical protein